MIVTGGPMALSSKAMISGSGIFKFFFMERSILFTGGGSAGHVTANLALMPEFAKAGWRILYIGSAGGIEASLVKKLPFVRYVPISTGKLRRYFSWKNFSDPFRVILGVWQAWAAVR